MPRTRPLGACVAAFLALVLVGGCSASVEVEPTPTPTPSATAAPTPTPTPTPSVDEPEPAIIATATESEIEVFDEPNVFPVQQVIKAEDVVSIPGQIPLTFLVVEQANDWVRVYLPVRPNGSTGWLRMADVHLASTDYRIEVRLTEHRLLLHKGSEVVMDVPVGVGREEVPTPGGVYYIKELLQPPTPGGTYGAYAYGLSGYSPVLESFAGGAGVIGIHGTNQPDSVGTDASHGCIRMHDEDITRLVTEFGLPLGTPVEIVA